MNKKLIMLIVGIIVLIAAIGIYASYTSQNVAQNTTNVSDENISLDNSSKANDTANTSDSNKVDKNKNNSAVKKNSIKAVTNQNTKAVTNKNNKAVANNKKTTGKKVVTASSGKSDPFADIDIRVSKKQALQIVKEFYAKKNIKYKVIDMNVEMYHGAPCWYIQIQEESRNSSLHVCTVAGEVKLYYPMPTGRPNPNTV